MANSNYARPKDFDERMREYSQAKKAQREQARVATRATSPVIIPQEKHEVMVEKVVQEEKKSNTPWIIIAIILIIILGIGYFFLM